MEATKKQKQLIHINAPTRDIKEEFVQWATEDVNKISTNDLSFDQANKILEKLGQRPHKPENWGNFSKSNPKHKLILSLLYQCQYTCEVNGKEVPDLERFAKWLKYKAPVKKPLLDMNNTELEKIIKALKGLFKSIWK
ncbi:hypothetical protein NBRC110019_07730 [Neptunitalea chrysea]|uniref:Uncharacterized protein n=1 Tax=Neptunitalea chrysea TaxID=1647581 RepID=A0A9W6B5M6_9FLAO|nr:hypothetical protein [Neptunitalea chrysea]GLB51734.1 hypothetical protein NBRC110019_07730 [Neptunitalea chrysea]